MGEQRELNINEILKNAPLDDEKVTLGDLLAIVRGEIEIANGNFVRYEDLDFKEMGINK